MKDQSRRSKICNVHTAITGNNNLSVVVLSSLNGDKRGDSEIGIDYSRMSDFSLMSISDIVQLN